MTSGEGGDEAVGKQGIPVGTFDHFGRGRGEYQLRRMRVNPYGHASNWVCNVARPIRELGGSRQFRRKTLFRACCWRSECDYFLLDKYMACARRS